MGPRAADPLAALLELPGVAQALDGARGAVDALLWDRAVSAARAEVTSESMLRGAWANAWFDGAECGLPELRSGAALDDSPVGRVLANTLALHGELAGMVDVIGTAPAQALARMHALAAHGFTARSELGRPRSDPRPDDPLRLGVAPGPHEVAERMRGVAALLVDSGAPGILVAIVAHAEVAVVRPFGWGSGLVARALPRLVLAQRGVDPGMLGAPELGLRMSGRPAYVRALRGYAGGSPQGVADLVVALAGGVEEGARQAMSWSSA